MSSVERSAERRVHRVYWAVTTVGGLFCVIYRDEVLGAWTLERVYD